MCVYLYTDTYVQQNKKKPSNRKPHFFGIMQLLTLLWLCSALQLAIRVQTVIYTHMYVVYERMYVYAHIYM